MVKAIFLGLFFIFGANHSEISSDGDTSSLIGVWKVTKVKLRKISTTDSDGIANLSRKEVIITSDSINFESLSIHEKIISIQADSIIFDQELADQLNIKKSKLLKRTK